MSEIETNFEQLRADEVRLLLDFAWYVFYLLG